VIARQPLSLLGALLALAAACLVVVGFFLPWMEGANELEYRSFSGFEFARLVRNFDIKAESMAAENQLRATAVALYLVPAAALNSALLGLLSLRVRWARRAARLAAGASGAYALVVLTAVLFLSLAPVSRIEDVAGAPAAGFAVTLAGAALLVTAGVLPREADDGEWRNAEAWELGR
jgi:hypothetical protein